MTVEQLKVVISAQTAGLKRELSNTRSQLTSLERQATQTSTKISGAFKKAATVIAAIGIGKVISNSFKEAYQVEAQMENLTRMLGKNMVQFKAWVENQANGYGISQAAAYRYGNTFSNLISSFTNDTATMTSYTTQLLESAAVIASRTGRTMEDVMMRLASGMRGETEAIEDLGINTKVNAIEQSKAFKQIAGNAPWASLAPQMQQQILLLNILEQSSSKYGSTMAGGVARQMLMFQASLDNLKLALGQAFLPIANVVLPYLTRFIQFLATAIGYVVAFSNALFGVNKAVGATSAITESTAKTSENLSAAATSAKKLKGTLSGFDNINAISTKGVESGSAPNTDGAMSNLNTEIATFNEKMDKVGKQVEEFRAAIAKAYNKLKDWLPLIAMIAVALGGLFLLFKSNAIAGWIEKIMPAGLYSSFTALQKIIFGFGSAITNAVSVLTGPWLAVIALVVGAIVDLWMHNETFKSKVMEAWNNIKDLISSVWTSFLKPTFEYIGLGLLAIWELGLKPLWDKWVEFVGVIAGVVLDIWNAISPLVKKFVDVFGPVIAKIIGAVALAFSGLVIVALKVFGGLLDFLSGFISFVAKGFGGLVTFFTTIFKPIFNDVKIAIENNINNIKQIFSGLINFITGVFTKDWGKAWDGVKGVFKGVFDSLYGVVKVPLNAVIRGINKFIGGINKIKINVPDGIAKLAGMASGTSFGFNIAPIPELANGGMVGKGQMFIANEAGPELVGSFGGKSGVMNNNQIVDAVSEGVFRAVSSALASQSKSNQSGDVILKIGEAEFGRIAAKSINNASRQAGVALVTV